MLKRLVLFGILNFAALALGGITTGPGVTSEWYLSLQKAPWTPPGWVFGFAWTLIMICFAIYMAKLWSYEEKRKTIMVLFLLQWVLNVIWNPLFFSLHLTFVSLIVIGQLTCLMALILWFFRNYVKRSTLLILPYVVWLIIATSLNAYIFIFN
jgi:translocator protein